MKDSGWKLLKISNYQRKLTPCCGLAQSRDRAAHGWRRFQKAERILKEFQPDVIVGTGGYASFPALKMGAKLEHSDLRTRIERRAGPDDKAGGAYGQTVIMVSFEVQPGALPGTRRSGPDRNACAGGIPLCHSGRRPGRLGLG